MVGTTSFWEHDVLEAVGSLALRCACVFQTLLQYRLDGYEAIF